MLNYQFYNLKFHDGKISSIQKLPHRKEPTTFTKPATTNKLPKIYLAKYKDDIVYVGITTQSITNRLRGGFIATSKHGYHGYKWKNLNEIDLAIFFFENPIEKIEAIEAEIVYLIRSETGFWPKYQTEIHFHNATKKEKEIARAIYEIVKTKL